MAYRTSNRIGFFLGPILFALMLLLPTPEGMAPEAQRVAAITLLMAVWWITEAVPIPATALLPIALFPLLGVMPSAKATVPYANHLIFLFMGGFFIAVTMERWNLHRRVAIATIRLVGTSPSRLVLGFMLATGFLSMWISNTATAMMMVPIPLAVIQQITGLQGQELTGTCTANPDGRRLGISLMLGVAYAASIGGVATLIGTPPNVIMASMLEKLYGQHIEFAQWLAFGLPLAAATLLIAWFLLTKVLFRVRGPIGDSSEVIEQEAKALGRMTYEERCIVVVGLTVCALWIVRGFLPPFPGSKLINDTTIAILGALVLFMIPVDFKQGKFLLDWKTAVRIPWDVILLFGGGLALADGFQTTGLAAWIAQQLTSLQGADMVVFIGVVVLMTIFLTEVTSNTATATLLVPVMGSAAVALAINPIGPIVAACVAASYAFMLPVATPPNAVVFGSGCVTIPQMARAGLWLNLIGTVLITVLIVWLLPLLWGIDLATLPAWAVK